MPDAVVETGAIPIPAASRSPRGSFVLVLLATAVVGVAGYVITWLVPRITGVEDYAVFAVFWSFVFLLVAGLSGIQQEITRATRLAETTAAGTRHRAARFGLVSAALVFVVVVASAPFWVGSVFPEGGYDLVWPLACGGAAFVLLAVLTGTLYGISSWGVLFWVILTEGVLRLALIGVALMFTHDPVVLGWAIVIPFGATIAIIWPAARGSIAGRTDLDVGYRALTWNVARTVVAATAMGVLVSGFPLILKLTSPDADPAELGLLILATTLVRAPLIVVGMAMQSYLVVLFRNNLARFWRILLALEGLVIAAGALLALLGWLFGPAVFEVLFPGEPVPSGALIAVLAASSALVGALCVTAPAVLSRARHSIFTAGWVTAALATVACLLLPIGLEARTMLALLVGPAAGLTVHVVFLAFSRERIDTAEGDRLL
ncbi:hypothetical protein ACFVAJ_01660 [Agromyces sp. NPDC057679]|uniref:hypothetical protein n=1 Tax=Agromyces sp. NPDC057679 TaxID=3346207 RepID=UPI00366E19C1